MSLVSLRILSPAMLPMCNCTVMIPAHQYQGETSYGAGGVGPSGIGHTLGDLSTPPPPPGTRGQACGIAELPQDHQGGERL